MATEPKAPGVDEVHILWISEGMSCDGDSVSVTAAGQQTVWSRRAARTERLAQALTSGFAPAEVARLAAAVPLIERLADLI